MKKKICALLVLLGLIMPLGVPAAAGAINIFPVCNGAASKSVVCQEQANGNKNPIINALKVALDIISIVAGFAAVILVILGGIKFTISGGDPSATKSARDTIIYALIGVVVVLFSQTIIAFVLDKIG